jgi:hypothetical protein
LPVAGWRAAGKDSRALLNLADIFFSKVRLLLPIINRSATQNREISDYTTIIAA